MRSTTARRTTSTLLALALFLALPGASLAAEAAVPDEMVDPVGAMEPEIEVGEPATPQPAPAAEGAPAPEAEAAGIDAPAEPTAPSATAGTARIPSAPAPTGGGSLPFTGPDSGLLVLMSLVGSLALCAGAVAFAHARAVAETA